LVCNLSRVSSPSAPILDGKLPIKLFTARFMNPKFVRLPKAVDNVPVKELLLKSTYTSWVILYNDAGMLPIMQLPFS